MHYFCNAKLENIGADMRYLNSGKSRERRI